jgi:hypothetical protein
LLVVDRLSQAHWPTRPSEQLSSTAARSAVIAAVALAVVGLLVWHAWPDRTAEPPADVDGRPATAKEAAAISTVIERVVAVEAAARRTGDISELVAVFIDDPAYPLFGEYSDTWDERRDDFEQLLDAAGWTSPDDLGLLTYTVATSLQVHRDGPPYLAGPSKPITISTITVDGDHAGATSCLREGGGTITHYALTLMDGFWRVSAIWTTCLPSGCA